MQGTEPPSKNSRASYSKVARFFFVIIFLLILSELVLQAGALLVKENAWRAKAHWLTGDLRILTLGDSNTYGLYLKQEESYPSQLESLWNKKHPELPVEVINLGYPGSNSFRLLANLPELLDTFKPDLVLVMIGFNDFWTPDEMLSKGDDTNLLNKIKHHSRLYKLFYMAFRGEVETHTIDSGKRLINGQGYEAISRKDIQALEKSSGFSMQEIKAIIGKGDENSADYQRLEPLVNQLVKEERERNKKDDILNTVTYQDKTFSLGIAQGSSARNSKKMHSNIKEIFSIMDERELNYALLNYPSSFAFYSAANKKITALAEESKVNFIDINSIFDRECSQKPDTCTDLFFYDAHATQKGNDLIAKKVMTSLEDFVLNP